MTAPTNNNFRVKNGLVVGNGSTCNAYTLPTLNGGSGTVITSNGDGTTAWTYSIQGLQGAQGLQGGSGIQGCIGAQGGNGLQGCIGAQGLQGPQGCIGLPGCIGAQGLQGPQGCFGTQGAQGLQGVSGCGIQGIQGPYGAQGVQGTSGGGGGSGANQALCTTSSVTFNSVNINNVYTNGTLISGITTPGTQVITSYDYTQYSGSKHAVVVTDSNKIHAEDISIVVNGDSYIIESNINTTDGTLGTYSVTTSSGIVILSFITTATTNMTISSQNTLFPYVSVAPGFSPADISGLRAWYDVPSANIGGGVWTDKSGNGFDGVINNVDGQISLVAVGAGSGSTQTNPAIQFLGNNSDNDYIYFPGEIWNTVSGGQYTWFSVSRWVGDGHSGGRQFTNWNGSNWIAGGFGTYAPMSYHDGWVPSYPPSVNYGNNWVVVVDQGVFMEGNANPATIGTNGSNTIPGADVGDHRIGIGRGIDPVGREYTANMYITEVIFYDRYLNSSEYGQVITYLGSRYGITLG